MKNKTCSSCIDNDNGLCDRNGILVENDDTCDKHREYFEDWREKIMHRFLKRN